MADNFPKMYRGQSAKPPGSFSTPDIGDKLSSHLENDKNPYLAGG